MSSRRSPRDAGPTSRVTSDVPVDLAPAPPPRPIAERLAAPGTHLIAEIKRASPSAGRIAGTTEDIVARARAYEAGGAVAISVLCEPHWFGGSVDDVRAVRAAVAIPVLAKEFVVDQRQLRRPACRRRRPRAAARGPAPGPARWPPRRRASCASAWSRSSRPMTPRSCERRSRPEPGSSGSTIGTCGRSRSTRNGPIGCAISCPMTASSSPSRGVRDAATIRRWRALGFDGALVGEALMRAADPVAAATARSSPPAGTPRIRPTSTGGRS